MPRRRIAFRTRLDLCTLPTIWDNLAAAGVSSRYYYSNVPVLALWGVKYIGISALYADFLADAAAGTLPSVSFLDPRFTILDDGLGNDDHPHADLRAGEAFLGQVYKAITNGPGWKNTVLIINRDEWGGFYDTVAPPRVVMPRTMWIRILSTETRCSAAVYRWSWCPRSAQAIRRHPASTPRFTITPPC